MTPADAMPRDVPPLAAGLVLADVHRAWHGVRIYMRASACRLDFDMDAPCGAAELFAAFLVRSAAGHGLSRDVAARWLEAMRGSYLWV